MAALTCPTCGRENTAGTPVCRCGTDLTTEVELSGSVAAAPGEEAAGSSSGPNVAVSTPRGRGPVCQSPGCSFEFSEGAEVCEFCGEPRPGAEAGPARGGWRVIGPGIEIAAGAGDRIVLGRQGDHPEGFADFSNVGRRHAELHVLADGSVEITDLDSRNGTFVNDRRLPAGGAHRAESGFDLRLAAHLVLRVEAGR